MARHRRRKLDPQKVTKPAEVTTSDITIEIAIPPDPPEHIPLRHHLIQLLMLVMMLCA